MRFVSTCLVCVLVVGGCGDNSNPLPGQMTLLTYNVAGLPAGISGSDPEAHMPQISPLLNGFDLALVQEDFWYHAELSADAGHPIQSPPYMDPPAANDIGDGLNRFSRSPFQDHSRTPWGDCEGFTDCASDCLASKGFSVARHTVSPGVEIDIYNLHHEAGGCERDLLIRERSTTLILEEIEDRSAGRAVIVAGDFNLHVDDPEDLPTFTRQLEAAGLTDACWHLNCGTESIDRVLYRGSNATDLEVLAWWQPPEFVDALDGSDLSDHTPTAVTLAWEPTR